MFVSLQCVFHSIRFKVNIRDSAESHFFCLLFGTFKYNLYFCQHKQCFINIIDL